MRNPFGIEKYTAYTHRKRGKEDQREYRGSGVQKVREKEGGVRGSGWERMKRGRL